MSSGDIIVKGITYQQIEQGFRKNQQSIGTKLMQIFYVIVNIDPYFNIVNCLFKGLCNPE